MQILTIARFKNRARVRRSLHDNCCGNDRERKLSAGRWTRIASVNENSETAIHVIIKADWIHSVATPEDIVGFHRLSFPWSCGVGCRAVQRGGVMSYISCLLSGVINGSQSP